MAYEFVRGRVSELQKETIVTTTGRVSRGSGSITSSEKTRQTFKIDGKTFLFSRAYLIENGDELILAAGKWRDGYFRVVCCENLTKHWSWCRHWHLGITMSIWAIPSLLFIFPIPFALIHYFIAKPVRKAYHKIKQLKQEG